MKKTILFSIMMMAVVNTIEAQLGYWYKSTFINLTPKGSSIYYVSPKADCPDEESKQILTEIENRYKVLSHIGEEGMIIETQEEPTDEKLFVSCYYETMHKSKIMIVPEISLRMNEGISIEEIIRKYDHYLKLEQNEKDRYLFKCNVHSSDDVIQLAMRIHDEKDIKWCEPVMLPEVKPCNTYYYQQYYLHDDANANIKAEAAWNMISGSPYVSVAVIDDGVEDTHEDMFVSVQYGYTVDDHAASWGRPKNSNTINCKGHGTSCAGIISAEDNTIGVKGVAPNTFIWPINIFPYEAYVNQYGDTINGGASSEKIAAAIRWAYPLCDIINISWEMDQSDAVEDAINEALTFGRNGKGCIVVAASGNDYNGTQTHVAFPASIDGVIAVGGIMSTGIAYPSSRGGTGLDLVAFYESIKTIDRMGDLGFDPGNYYTIHGTSAACAQVSGVVALMLAANSNLTRNQVRYLLLSSCQKSWGHNPAQMITTWNDRFGYGLLDAEESVFKSLQLNISGPTVPEISSVYSVTGLGSASYPVTWSWQTPCSIPIVQNSPSANQCTISNTNKEYINNVLVASITSSSGTTRTVKKTIHSGANFSGTYSQEGGEVIAPIGGTTYYDPIPTTPFSDNSFISVHRILPVSITSPMFSSSTLSAQNGSLPTSWNQNGNTITYNFPRTGGPVIVPIIGRSNTGYDVYKFTLGIEPDFIDPGLPFLSSGNGMLTISLGEELDDGAGVRSTETDIDDLIWDVKIVNVMTGDITYKGQVSGLSKTIFTNGWPKGFYVVYIDFDGQRISRKISIK